MFYTDDAVFIGEWRDSNFSNIVNILQCFFLAFGLKINIQKCRLMGIGVTFSEVESVTSYIGCAELKALFTYLGVLVGGSMSKINTWSEVVQKVVSRLSNWKVKSLSIGGRLTLLKSVLRSLPTYFMSLFKDPVGVLSKLEYIRSKFFIGAEKEENNLSWVSWEKVMASKDNGDLGVTSLFALNRALLFKWIWRFKANTNAFWVLVVKSIHGSHGWLDREPPDNKTSV